MLAYFPEIAVHSFLIAPGLKAEEAQTTSQGAFEAPHPPKKMPEGTVIILNLQKVFHNGPQLPFFFPVQTRIRRHVDQQGLSSVLLAWNMGCLGTLWEAIGVC
jgi:hypothetical protein